MKITIADNEENFEENDLKFIKLLEEDEWLESSLISARLTSGVPEKGFDRSKPIEESAKEGLLEDIHYEKLWNEAVKFTLVYNKLPTSWIYTFINLILFNVVTPPDRAKNKPMEVVKVGGEVKIIIREAITPRGLTDYINKNEVLKGYLSALPKNPKINIQIDRLMIKKRMLELSKSGKTSKQMRDILSEEFGGDLGFESDAYEIINSLRYRFGKYLDVKIHDKDFEAVIKFMMLQDRRNKKRRTR